MNNGEHLILEGSNKIRVIMNTMNNRGKKQLQQAIRAETVQFIDSVDHSIDLD